MKKSELEVQVVALRAQVAELERARKRAEHVHRWRYNKTMTDYGAGLTPFWSWECIADGCELGEGGTNYSAGLPDHFPRELR